MTTEKIFFIDQLQNELKKEQNKKLILRVIKSSLYVLCSIAAQIPDKEIFVMGDHRKTSIDSRSRDVGCIPVDEIVGKIVLRIWPFKDFTVIE